MTTLEGHIPEEMKEIKVRLWGTDIVAGISRCTAIVSASFMPLKPTRTLLPLIASVERKKDINEHDPEEDVTYMTSGSSSAAPVKRKRKGAVMKQGIEVSESTFDVLVPTSSFNSETGEGERPTISSLSLPPFSLHSTFPSISLRANHSTNDAICFETSVSSEVILPVPHLTLAQKKKNDIAFHDSVNKFWKTIEDENYFQPFSKKVHRMDDLSLKGGDYNELTGMTPKISTQIDLSVTNITEKILPSEATSDTLSALGAQEVSHGFHSHGFHSTSDMDMAREKGEKHRTTDASSTGPYQVDLSSNDLDQGDHGLEFLYKRIVASFVIPRSKELQSQSGSSDYPHSLLSSTSVTPKLPSPSSISSSSISSSSISSSSSLSSSISSSSSSSSLFLSVDQIYSEPIMTIPIMNSTVDATTPAPTQMKIIAASPKETKTCDKLENDEVININFDTNFNDGDDITINLKADYIDLECLNDDKHPYLFMCNSNILESESNKLQVDKIENVFSCYCQDIEYENTEERKELTCSCNSNSNISVESSITTQSLSLSSSSSTTTSSQVDCSNVLFLDRNQRTILELAELGLINSFDFLQKKKDCFHAPEVKKSHVDIHPQNDCSSSSSSSSSSNNSSSNNNNNCSTSGSGSISYHNNKLITTTEETDIEIETETETEMETITKNNFSTINWVQLSHNFEIDFADDDICLSIRYLVQDLKSNEHKVNERLTALRNTLSHPTILQENDVKRKTIEVNRLLLSRWQKLRKKGKITSRTANKSSQK